MNIYKQIKKEITVLFFEENNFGFQGSYGYEPFKSHELIYITDLTNQYKSYGLEYFFLPLSLKQLISNPNEYNRTHNAEKLEIFQYPMKQKATHKILEYMAEMDEITKTELYQKINREAYVKDFENKIKAKYGDQPSCIRINIFEYMTLIGKRESIQNITNLIKKEYTNTEELIQNIINPKAYQTIINSKKAKSINQIIIYDLLNTPKKTILQKNK